MSRTETPQSDPAGVDQPDPAVGFSRRTAFRFAAGAAGVAAVTAAGAAPAQAEPRPHQVECAADLEEN